MISSGEQKRIIRESGVLNARKEDEEPVVVMAIAMALPLWVLQLVLVYLVQAQFGYEHEFTLQFIVRKQLPLLPVLMVFIYLTCLIRHTRLAQLGFFGLAVALGVYLVHVNTVLETYGAMMTCPGIVTVLVYLVIQMDLVPATLAVICMFAYYHKDIILFLLNGTFLDPPLLKPDL